MKRESSGSATSGPGGALFFKALSSLCQDPCITGVARLAGAQGLATYLVGGALRNIFLRVPLSPDYDFVIEAGRRAVAELAKSTALELGGTAFVLDRENGLYRVAVRGRLNAGNQAGVTTATDSTVTLDFLPLYRPTIEDDLARRDFTVNAMALPLHLVPGPEGRKKGAKSIGRGKTGETGPEAPALIDPFGGVRDCASRLLRLVSHRALQDDPLRCLRAVRLAQEYGLVLDPRSREEIRRHACLMAKRHVAVERIRDELLIVFGRKGTADSVRELSDLGLLGVVMPPLADLHLSSERLPTLIAIDEILEEMKQEDLAGDTKKMKAALGSTGRPLPEVVLRLAAFFIDITAGKGPSCPQDTDPRGLATDVLRGLAIGKKTTRAVRGLLRLLLLLGAAPARALDSPLFRRLFIDLIRRETGLAPPVFHLLALAFERANKPWGEEAEGLPGKALSAMLEEYGRQTAPSSHHPLFTGDYVKKTLGICQGQAVGSILRSLEGAVLSGEVRDLDEAEEYMKKLKNEMIGLTKG